MFSGSAGSIWNLKGAINFKEKKIDKCLELKEKAKVIIFAGKHSGEKGIVSKMNPEGKAVEVDIDGKKVNILIKQLMVVEWWQIM